MLATKAMAIVIASIAVLAVVALAMMVASLSNTGKQRQHYQPPTTQDTETQRLANANSQDESKRGAGVERSQNPGVNFLRYMESHEKLVSALSAILMVVVTIALVCVTVSLSSRTRDLVTGADKASAIELRPYVYLEISSTLYQGNPTAPPNRHVVSLTIVNSGKSWARNLRIAHSTIPNPIPGSDPFESAHLEQKLSAPLVLAPGQRMGFRFGELGEILITDMKELEDRKRQLFYAGWVIYDDPMGNPPVKRQTQISVQLNADTEGLFGHISFSYLPTHNCVDGDCP
jgi:hypothetical protein